VDRGLYITYKLQVPGDSCIVVVLANEEIVHTTCQTSTNSKGKDIYCTKRKKLCKIERELLGENPHKRKISSKKTHNKKASSGYAKDLAAFQEECNKGNKMHCYSVKRYKLFKAACDKGDKHSCKNLSDLRKYQHGMANGDTLAAQSFNWSINNEKTSEGK
jgi:hypothetical protein